MTASSNPQPEPGDPDFFARFTLSDDILEDAFGPTGGAELPRITRRPARAGHAEDASAADLGYFAAGGADDGTGEPDLHDRDSQETELQQ